MGPTSVGNLASVEVPPYDLFNQLATQNHNLAYPQLLLGYHLACTTDIQRAVIVSQEGRRIFFVTERSGFARPRGGEGERS
jgi:hypothetical protein